ncbi:alpha-2Db adrenergic receptor-like [Branchiostoma floridae x Branchiostoma japonicum]
MASSPRPFPYNTSVTSPTVHEEVSAIFPTDNPSSFGEENGTVCTTGDYPYTYNQTVFISSIVSVVILGIIVGNFFVCTSTLTQRKLRTVHNWFLTSLAIADLLVGVLIMPLALVNELLGYWYFGEVLCEVFLSTDIFVCTASILNLCGIAIDRYWAATNATDLAGIMERRRAKIAIAVVWFLAFLISVPPLFGWKDGTPWDPACPQCRYSSDVGYVLFSTSGSFVAPLVFITIAYANVYLAVTRRLMKKSPRQKPTPAAKEGAQNTPAITVELATRSEENCDQENGKIKPSVSFETKVKSVSGSSSTDLKSSPLRRSYSLDTVLASGADLISSRPRISEWFSSLAISDIALTIQADTATNAGQANAHERSGTLNRQDEASENEMLSTRKESGSQPEDESSPQEPCHCLKSDSQDDPSAAADAQNKDVKQIPFRRHKSSRRSVMAEMRGHLQNRERFLKRKERRLTLILGIVIAAFVVCWLPFFVTYVTVTVCETCVVSDVMFKVFVWLGYCNSAINPVIYTIFNKDFVAIFGAVRKAMCAGGACH